MRSGRVELATGPGAVLDAVVASDVAREIWQVGCARVQVRLLKCEPTPDTAAHLALPGVWPLYETL